MLGHSVEHSDGQSSPIIIKDVVSGENPIMLGSPHWLYTEKGVRCGLEYPADSHQSREVRFPRTAHIVPITADVQAGAAGHFRVRKPDLARPLAQCIPEAVHT